MGILVLPVIVKYNIEWWRWTVSFPTKLRVIQVVAAPGECAVAQVLTGLSAGGHLRAERETNIKEELRVAAGSILHSLVRGHFQRQLDHVVMSQGLGQVICPAELGQLPGLPHHLLVLHTGLLGRFQGRHHALSLAGLGRQLGILRYLPVIPGTSQTKQIINLTHLEIEYWKTFFRILNHMKKFARSEF